MAGKGGYSVVIEAVDKASARIDAVNKQIAKMNAPIQRVQKSLVKFADLSGISAIGNGIRGLASRAMEAFSALGRIISPLGMITGAASLAGMARLVTVWSDFGSKLGFASQRIGVASDRLQAMQGAARLAGGSGEALTGAMRTLGDNMVDAVGGRAPEVVIMMNTLGIAFRNADGSARKAADVLPDIADKLSKIENPTLRARAGTALLGGAYEELAPFLARGREGMEEYRREAEKYGVINEKGVAAAGRMRMAQTKLTMSVEGLGNSIAEKLGPILEPLLTQMADWIAANRDWIATGIGEAVSEFADYLKTIDWKGIGTSIKNFATDANGVVQAIGGWKTALKTLLAFWTAKFVAEMLIGGAQIIAKMVAVKAAIVETQAAGGVAGKAAGAVSALGGLAAVGGGAYAVKSGLDAGSDWLQDKITGPGSAEKLRKMHEDDSPFRSAWWKRTMPTWLGGAAAPRETSGAGAGPGSGPGSSPGPGATVPQVKGNTATLAGATPNQKELLRAALDAQGVTDPGTRAGIAAIAGGESGFQSRTEQSYAGTSDDRIRRIFKSRLGGMSDPDLDKLKKNPEAFFNATYGGMLGNASNEGYKYRGRGLFQLTGKDNYDRYGKMIGVDLVSNPDLANDPAVAAQLSVAYMKDRYKGGGFEGMKRAVGNSVGETETVKNSLFNQYLASGEFGSSNTQNAQLLAQGAPAANIRGGSGASAAQNVNLQGGANLTVTLAGDANRSNTKAVGSTTGNVFAGGPKVEYAMAG